MSTLSITKLLPKEITIKNIKTAKDALSKIFFIANIAREALIAFKNSLFERFDGLGGDNACQIRALFVVVFSKKREELTTGVVEKIDALRGQLDAKKEKLESIKDTNFLRPCDIEDSTKRENIGSLSLDEFCKRTKLQLELTDNIAFLFRSFILEKIKTVDAKGTEIENPALVDEFFPKEFQATKSFKSDFVSKMQRELSQQSVTFIQSLLKNKMLDFVATDKFTRKCFNCFSSTKTILNVLKEKKEPVLIKIFNQNTDTSIDKGRSINLLFKSNDGLSFQLARKGEGALFVIEGYCRNMCEEKTPDEFKKNGLENIMLAGAAQHPQFFNKDDPKDASMIEAMAHDEEFSRFKALSSTIGCSEDNPSLFCVDHIFASSFESQGAISEL